MIEKLSDILVNYSIEVQKDEKVLITYKDYNAKELIIEIIKQINKAGGIVFVKKLMDDSVSYYINKDNSNSLRIDMLAKQAEFESENFDSFIQIHTTFNDYEDIYLDPLVRQAIGLKCRKARDIRVNNRKWVLLNFPNSLDSYKSKMNSVEYYNYALECMTVDYKKMNESLIPLKELMEKTDKVRITGINTDITFNIKGLPAKICAGKRNIPDGEIYSAPIKTSVNGIITYNTITSYDGFVFTGVSLELKNGKIINATCNEDNQKLNEILDKDEGARYIGEFAIGVNPKITVPVGETLYDEKIIGSIHFTPGNSYDDCDNGNKSMVHWDMVLIQTEKFGGGNIYFDDVLIRENGIFITDELKHLNA